MIYRKIMEISTLTDLEYVTLIGHYSQVGSKSLESQLLSKNYSSERIQQIKDKMKSMPVNTVRSLNVEFKTNNNFIFEGFSYYYGLYRSYSENGILPFEGCLADQPCKIIEVFEVFEQLQIEKENEQLKEAKKNNKQTNKR